jgi:hypothetical protein
MLHQAGHSEKQAVAAVFLANSKSFRQAIEGSGQLVQQQPLHLYFYLENHPF